MKKSIKGRRMTQALVFIMSLNGLIPNLLWGCTSVVVGDKNLFLLGQNYDFAYDHGAIFVQGRGKQKYSLGEKNDLPVKWMTKYSSIIISQFGRELPASGMNEKGLIVQQLWNLDGSFPKIDPSRTAAVNELQWVQYQLDTAQSTDDVISSLSSISIKKSFAELHYVVCDSSSKCALIEYDGGDLKIYRRNKDYEPSTITNNSLPNSVAFYEPFKNKPLEDIPIKKKSLNVFARAAWMADHFNYSSNEEKSAISNLHSILAKSAVDYEFMDLIRSIFSSQPPSITAWSVVYDSKSLSLTFKSRKNSSLRTIAAAKLFRQCGTSDLALNIDSKTQAIILESDFSKDSQTENRRIIEKSYAPIEDQFPKTVQEELLKYAESFACID